MTFHKGHRILGHVIFVQYFLIYRVARAPVKPRLLLTMQQRSGSKACGSVIKWLPRYGSVTKIYRKFWKKFNILPLLMIYYLFTTISLMFTKKVQVVSGSGTIIQDSRIRIHKKCSRIRNPAMQGKAIDGLYLCNQEKRPGWSISL